MSRLEAINAFTKQLQDANISVPETLTFAKQAEEKGQGIAVVQHMLNLTLNTLVRAGYTACPTPIRQILGLTQREQE